MSAAIVPGQQQPPQNMHCITSQLPAAHMQRLDLLLCGLRGEKHKSMPFLHNHKFTHA